MNFYDDIAAAEAAQRPAPLPADSTYDTMAAQEAEQRRLAKENALKAALNVATQIEPVKAGKTKALADRAALPVPVVERNEDYVAQQQRARDLWLAIQDSPVLRRQMVDPEFAKIAQDDTPNLTTLEKAVRFAWAPVKGIASGLPALAGGLYGAAAAPFELASEYVGRPLAGKLLPADPFGQVGASLRGASKNLEGYTKRVADLPRDMNVVEAGLASGFQSLGQNIVPLISAVYTGNAPAALAIMSTAAGGQSYTKARDTLSPIAATRYGMTDAAIEYLTEMMPLTKLIGEMKAGAPFIKAFMHNQVAEQIGEQAATVLQDYNEWVTLTPEKTFVEYLKERPAAALQTAIATVIGSGGQVALLHALAQDRDSAVGAAAEDAKQIEEMLRAAGASLLRERSPATFEAFMRTATGESGAIDAVFVHAGTFQQSALEAGIDVKKTMPETAAALSDALATDSDVRIPLSELATVAPGTKLEQSLIPFIRTREDGPTQQETADKAWVEETKAQTEKILAEQEFNTQWKQSREVVTQDLLQQLNTANRFTPDVNAAYAGFMSAFYATQAHRLGITPEQMYQRYPLRIQAQQVAGAGVLMQPVNIPGIVERHMAAGGGTWDLRTGEPIQSGFAVAGNKARERVIPGQATPEQVAQFVEENRDLLSRPGNHLGTWFNAADQSTYLDIATVVEDLNTALRIGQHAKQIAVYDITGGQEIKVPEFTPVQQAAVSYMEGAGLPYVPPVLQARVQVERAKRIAQAYDEMAHAPDDPQVAAAYKAMIDETLAQWQAIKKTGLRVQFIKPGENPYKVPRDAIDDINKRNHLWVFPTDSGFGSDDTDVSGNPLLEPTGEFIDGRNALANDIFRIVHDYFGHAKDGHGFRANGEENAWRSHSAMYSPLARRAMTTETRGQNSWVNFGPHGEANRTASQEDTVYAPQKTGLLPEWVSTEGADDATTFRQSGRVKVVTPAIRKFLRNLKASERNKITDGVAKRILEHLQKLPSANEMAAIAHAGRAKRGWYSESAKAISHVFGPDAPHFAMLLAAMSPQTSVESNLRNALNTWKNWIAAGRPQSREAIIDVMAASVEQSGTRAAGGRDSVLDAWVNNTVRALSYDDVTNIPMSGPKVSSFYANLMGEVDEITLDTWMANYALVNNTMFKGNLNPRTDDPGKGSGYLAYNARVREAAARITELTGERWTPAEVQETIWSWAKSLYELAESTGTTAVESLKAGTLTNSLIASTPDFGSLFNEPEYAAILEEAGYADELDSLRGTREATQRQPGEDTDAGAEAAPFASEAQRRYELAAARRLDRLKATRELGGQLAQSGFHGSPHIFDEFSLHAIGSGEGAQAYGWGLYFTSKKEIARWYRDMLTPLEDADGNPVKSAGRIYEAQIPDDDVLLDWDKPLPLQNEVVKTVLRELGAWSKYTELQDSVTHRGPVPTGEDLYRRLVRDETVSRAGGEGAALAAPAETYSRDSAAAVSRRLASLGIKGIKYRGGSSGETNFVVFEDAQIQMLRFEQSPEQRKADEELWNALTQVQEQLPARGTIDFGPDIKRQASVISLLAGADLSTFLHESGHFYLEVLTDLAGQPNAHQSFVDDLHTVLKWFGVTPDDWSLMTLEEKRPYHEQWARGVESYLFEGKAPAVELQGLFGRFRAWMLNVYQNLVNLNVTLTDEVRGVMDRLLATSEQITDTETARNMLPVFDAKPADMTDDEWRAYQNLGIDATQEAVDQLQTRSLRDMQWLTRARGRALAALQKDADAKRAIIRKEVTAEVNAMPVYQAERGLKRGWKQDDGSVISLKLNTGALAEMYPESMVDRPDLSKLQGMTNAETGLHPDTVAGLVGFTSGDELVRKLTTAEDRQSVIEGITDQRMLERYGDLADPASIARAADESVHNEARAKFVAIELRALDKAANPRVPTGETITDKKGRERELTRPLLTGPAKEFAATLISRKRIRDIKPAQFTAAEARASKAAEKAVRADDVATAAAQKRVQLVNLYAAKAAHSALTEIEKAVTYLKRIGDSKTVDAEYREQIEALLERFDLRRVSESDTERRQNLTEWVEDQRAKGFEPVIDPALLDEAKRKPFQEMTLEDFRGLVDAVRNIEHLGRLKHKLLTLKDAREFKAVVAELVTSIDSNAKRTLPAKLERNTWLDKMKDGVSEFFAMHRKFSMMGRELDGHQDNGAFWRYLVRPMNAAGDAEALLREAATIKLQEIFKPLLAAGKLREKTFIPAINASLSREGRIMVALNVGNEGNLQRLMDGDHWSDKQVQAVVDTLTKEEMDFVQQVWDYVGSYRDRIGAQQKRLTGVEPEWVAPRKVVTPHGEYAGGYMPAKYDTKRSTRSMADEAAQSIMDQWRGKRGVAKARDSFTKDRANKVVDRPLRKDFGVITQHISEVTHRLAWQEFLVDANRLLRASAVDGAIREHYGPEVLEALRNTVEDVAAGEVPAQSAFESGLNHLRHGATIAGLGWRLTTSLLQPFGLTQSMVRIGPKWVAKGMAEWLGDAARMENTATRIYDKSDMMRLRAKTMQREINEIRNQVSGQSTAIQASYFYLIQKMQLVADIPTWLGQYHKAVEGGADEAGAVAQADQAVLDAQGGGQIKDLSAIQRGGPLLKLFTNFYSFFNTTYNLTKESVGRTKFSNPLSMGRLAVDMLLLYSVPAVLGTLLKAALKAGDDDQDEDKLIRQLIADQLTYLFGTVVGLREVAGGVQGAVGLPGDYQGPASVRLFTELAKLGKQAGQGEIDEAFLKALNNTGGILLHYPAGQINATLDGIVSLAQGKTASPGALIVGTTNQ